MGTSVSKYASYETGLLMKVDSVAEMNSPPEEEDEPMGKKYGSYFPQTEKKRSIRR